MATKAQRLLTSAWTPIQEAEGIGPTGPRYAAYHSKARYVVIKAGRRSTKTLLAKRRLVRALYEHLITPKPWSDPRFFYAAPTEGQAKAIAWNDLLALIPKELILNINRTELKVETILGSSIQVIGLDKPSRMEGRPWDGGIMDEYADIKAGAWEDNVFPALADRAGWCWQIGVPDMNGPSNSEFQTHYAWGQDPSKPEWESYHWTSVDVLPPEEIRIARRDMSPIKFRQEFMASDENSPDRAYVEYSEAIHVRPTPYIPGRVIMPFLDFNFGHHHWGLSQYLPDREEDGQKKLEQYRIFGEVYLTGATVVRMCAELERKLKALGIDEPRALNREQLVFFGDYAGEQQRAEATDSAWQQVKNYFPKAGFAYEPSPQIADRVEKVNSLLMNDLGESRIQIDPSCDNMKRDLAGVTYRMLYGASTGKSGQLTHISDGLGYLLVQHGGRKALERVVQRIKSKR